MGSRGAWPEYNWNTDGIQNLRRGVYRLSLIHICYYYTDSRYIESAGRQVTGAAVSLPDADRNYRQMVQAVIDRHGVKRLGFEKHYMTVEEYELYAAALSAELAPASDLLEQLRASKDQEEIDLMVRAQRISERALDEILGFIQPGLTEKEIAAKLQYDMLRFGAEKMSFDPIVVWAPTAACPTASPGTGRWSGATSSPWTSAASSAATAPT